MSETLDGIRPKKNDQMVRSDWTRAKGAACCLGNNNGSTSSLHVIFKTTCDVKLLSPSVNIYVPGAICGTCEIYTRVH